MIGALDGAAAVAKVAFDRLMTSIETLGDFAARHPLKACLDGPTSHIVCWTLAFHPTSTTAMPSAHSVSLLINPNHDRVSERADQQRAKQQPGERPGWTGSGQRSGSPRRATIVNARRQQDTANLAPRKPSPQPARQATNGKMQNALLRRRPSAPWANDAACRLTPADAHFTVTWRTRNLLVRPRLAPCL